MAYGTVKVDNITFDNGGADQNITVSGLYKGLTTEINVTGTVSGQRIEAVSGDVTNISGTNISYTTGTFNTANAISGVFASGTASNPSITFTGDLNTGFYSPAVDELAIATAGGERIRIQDDGDIGINTTTPSAKLHVLENASTPAVFIQQTGAGTALAVSGSTIFSGVVTATGLISASTFSGQKVETTSGVITNLSGTTATYTSGVITNLSGTTATYTSGNFTNISGDSSTLASGVFSGDVQIGSINSGPLAGFRNAIINGNFDIWQRGTSLSTTANVYLADRWLVVGDAKDISQRVFGLGGSPVSGDPAYLLKVDYTNTSSAGPSIQQRIESVRTFAGEEVTLSFWARSTTGDAFNVVLAQFFGTGGSPSSTVTTSVLNTGALTSTLQKFTATVTVPSTSGKTLGTDGNDSLRLVFNAPANTVCSMELAQVQLELGPVATPFERRSIGVELALCQRYYELSNGGNLVFSGNVTSGQVYDAAVEYKVTKRALPNIELVNAGANNFPASVGTIQSALIGGIRERRTADGTGMGRFISGWSSDAEL